MEVQTETRQEVVVSTPVTAEMAEGPDGLASQQESGEEEWPPQGQVFALNSRRLTSFRLKRIGESLGVSTDASVSEIRQMIEGRFQDMGHEPCNVQVIVQGDGERAVLYLVDDSGTIRKINGGDHEVLSRDGRNALERPRAVSEEQNVIKEGQKDTTSDGDIEPHDSGDGGEELEAELERLRAVVEEQKETISSLEEHNETIRDLEDGLSEARLAIESHEKEIEDLQAEIAREKQRSKRFWKLRCELMLEHEELLEKKEDEIALLKEKLNTEHSKSITKISKSIPLSVSSSRSSSRSTSRETKDNDEQEANQVDHSRQVRGRGKAPPVDPFTGEQPDVLWEDWLSTFERASIWNGWSESEKLLQLAGHLRGKALQEWTLLGADATENFGAALAALRNRLDPGGPALAAQDFRHLTQQQGEIVADFIRRLESVFRRAYGREKLSAETRDALLYGQLQEGLRYDLLKSPAVSGARTYQELCISARSEERRQSELLKRQQYHQQQSSIKPLKKPGDRDELQTGKGASSNSKQQSQGMNKSRHCWNCDRAGHFAKDCKLPKRESVGPTDKSSRTKMVKSGDLDDPSSYLQSDSDESLDVKVVHVTDRGSEPKCVQVAIGGVPCFGIVDSGADISIMGGKLFKQVAAVARLHKRDFQRPDKTPRGYDRKPFHIDGKVNLDICFQDKVMNTPVYVKMDAPEQLLLSEGTCRQLGIISYHPEVHPVKVPKKMHNRNCTVPAVRVRLIQDVRILPYQSSTVKVQLDGVHQIPKNTPLLLEADSTLWDEVNVQLVNALVQPADHSTALVRLDNYSGISQKMESGRQIGIAQSVEVVAHMKKTYNGNCSNSLCLGSVVGNVTSPDNEGRKQKLIEHLVSKISDSFLSEEEQDRLLSVIGDYHDVFSLNEGERGETDLVEMNIDTGEAAPTRQAVRRLPFAVRQEVAQQLKEMQDSDVIQPSNSPWASPIVLARKKDGTLRMCVDYRKLNSVTKPDKFPLPRIDDLLDQLGKSKYFSTLDLAAGFWQIRMNKSSKEKTAFVTQNGLFEFQVMPFGLTNAPAVFQRLMQRVISDLNPPEGPDFVGVYVDDLLISSRTFEEHLVHLSKVMGRLRSANLKLKLTKCHFVRPRVEYLGHVISSEGLSPNPKQVAAVTNYPQPQSLTQVRQFLGLTSYYRRFIGQFAKIAAPLHNLTRKDVSWKWNEECQQAFECLKQKLVQAPILAYPNFERDFVLETDASVKGIGAVLSQKLDDGRLHPVAYASRSLSVAERNYSITELETLAVVWAVQHFRAYLYGHNVMVITDHSAVKSILETPGSSGKHARWWLKVFGCGIGQVNIVYRPGRENTQADALSRNPVSSADEGQVDIEAHVMQMSALQDTDISELLDMPLKQKTVVNNFYLEQRKDSNLRELCDYLECGTLPENSQSDVRQLVAKAMHFTIVDHVLYFVDHQRGNRKRAAVPVHLQEQILLENHGGIMAGHFSGQRLYNVVSRRWWWDTLYHDSFEFSRNCAECAVVSGYGRRNQPPLHPIPVQRPFQILGVDIMELPVTEKGNRYVIVFQDFLTKWPLVFPAPDQKAIRIARLLAEEVLPLFGCPESLLSDRGTNLLALVMQDVCQLLGTTKLNTAYHPQCDGMVERMNRTLKSMLRKHVAKFGSQWDRYLPGVLWAYRNTPHESTKEKPSFLLYGVDLRSPTEAALLPTEQPGLIEISDYREELILSLSSARELAVSSIQAAQQRYKQQYDRKSRPVTFKLGHWVLVRFPQDETGKQRKLSRPWHGPYRVTQINDPDITVVKVFFPDDGPIQVHQSRACMCPEQLPAGFYWYGGNRKSAGKVPKWVDRLLSQGDVDPEAVDGPDIIREETLSEATPSDALDESDVLDGCGSSDGAVSTLPSKETTVQPAPVSYSLRDRSKIKPPQRLRQLIE